MTKIKIRTYPYPDDKIIELCKHIKINGEETNDSFPSCEYLKNLFIECKLCKIKHEVIVAVN